MKREPHLKTFCRLVCCSIKVNTFFLILFHALGTPVKDNKDLVAFNNLKAWHLESSELCGVLNKPCLTNCSLRNWPVLKIKKTSLLWAHRKSLHHLPDALCQQVRALIDLRLLNCALIKERPCSVPSFLLILTIYLVLAWTQLGSMWRSGMLVWVYFPSDASLLFHGQI